MKNSLRIGIVYEQDSKATPLKILDDAIEIRSLAPSGFEPDENVCLVDIILLVYFSRAFVEDALPAICLQNKRAQIVLIGRQVEINGISDIISQYSSRIAGWYQVGLDKDELDFFILLPSPPKKKKEGSSNTLWELTDREMEVLILLAEGYSNKMIAKMLFISENTAKTHVRRVFEKLQFDSRAKAARYAFEAGIAKPLNK